MNKDLSILKNLKMQGFINLDNYQIFNYLDILDYDLKKTKYIGMIVSKNESSAKYFFDEKIKY